MFKSIKYHGSKSLPSWSDWGHYHKWEAVAVVLFLDNADTYTAISYHIMR